MNLYVQCAKHKQTIQEMLWFNKQHYSIVWPAQLLRSTLFGYLCFLFLLPYKLRGTVSRRRTSLRYIFLYREPYNLNYILYTLSNVLVCYYIQFLKGRLIIWYFVRSARRALYLVCRLPRSSQYSTEEKESVRAKKRLVRSSSTNIINKWVIASVLFRWKFSEGACKQQKAEFDIPFNEKYNALHARVRHTTALHFKEITHIYTKFYRLLSVSFIFFHSPVPSLESVYLFILFFFHNVSLDEGENNAGN